jgi:hypothetical protein
MRVSAFTLLVGTSWLLVAAVSAQQPLPSAGRISFASLKSNVEQAVDTGRVRELNLRASAEPSPSAARTFALAGERRLPGRIRRERNPQLSSDRLVVVVRDGEARELTWQIVLNPWMVRLETPDASGLLSGRTFETRDQPWTLAVPDLVEARSITIYEPRWTGSEYELDPIGHFQVP